MTYEHEYETTCNPDAIPPAGDFYVTARDLAHKRVGFLLGPYSDYREAIFNERVGRRLAAPADHFNEYVYGVSRLPQNGTLRPHTVFGR